MAIRSDQLLSIVWSLSGVNLPRFAFSVRRSALSLQIFRGQQSGAIILFYLKITGIRLLLQVLFIHLFAQFGHILAYLLALAFLLFSHSLGLLRKNFLKALVNELGEEYCRMMDVSLIDLPSRKYWVA